MRASSGWLVGASLLAWMGCDGPAAMPGTDAGVPPGDGSVATGDAGTLVGTHPTGAYVDPTCTDGRYAEVLPDPSVSIADLTASYDAANVDAFIDAVLARRYPTGAQLVTEGNASGSVPAGQTCPRLFLSETGSANAVIQQLDTIVHECGHMTDGARSRTPTNEYVLTTSLVLTAVQGDTTTRNGLTFERSRIRDDDYQTLRMPCGASPGAGCDTYADTYLDGDPDDATFQGGDQGFNLLFEELVQYVHSLATGFAFQDVYMIGGRRVSERDGLLTFLWYTERYLQMARTAYPSAYAHLLNGDGGRWRQAILTVWGRAWLYLEQSASLGSLGIDDDDILPLVIDPDLLDEIERLRTADGC